MAKIVTTARIDKSLTFFVHFPWPIFRVAYVNDNQAMGFKDVKDFNVLKDLMGLLEKWQSTTNVRKCRKCEINLTYNT